eukprot:TRINITY_DN16135_c0_g1_i1.p1 TRINITY_DN16135_c0_g1~~TRINITY_DN16135_c0_g1_i1.p1  ORF type:complete len:367 (+),score=79.77 TRINITY_DN16135_c0_g1_i1:303-1403(+)
MEDHGRAKLCLCLVLFACRAVCVVDARPFGLASILQLPDSAVTDEHPVLNNRPLIGILSQPGDGDGGEVVHKDEEAKYNTSYIAASYVKFVETGGARAVPIMYDASDEELERVFKSINGLLIPGGGADLHLNTTIMHAVSKLLQLALEANDRGDYFPVHGTCMGFEALSIWVTQDDDVLERFVADGFPGPLNFVSKAARRGSMFRAMSNKLKDKLEVMPLGMENHDFGLSPAKMVSNGALSNFFRMLTTTPDQNGKVYVSSVEARNYPIYGTQWHPEKNVWEWHAPAVPHSEDAVLLTQAAANFFVSEARKSGHQPASLQEEQELLIYNYQPYYSGKDAKGYFDQVYIFDAPPGSLAQGQVDANTV